MSNVFTWVRLQNILTFKRQPQKMVKPTQTIRQLLQESKCDLMKALIDTILGSRFEIL